MKKLIVAATGAAAMLAASSLTAIAAEATGSIVRIDTTSGTVMLDDGKWFFFPTTVALADFKVGQKVKIMFDAAAHGAASSITVDG
jgi:hypothetical protein